MDQMGRSPGRRDESVPQQNNLMLGLTNQLHPQLRSELLQVCVQEAEACHDPNSSSGKLDESFAEGGVLTVSCGRAGGQIELAFSDTGVGIPPEELRQIFEPFFSRRADGVRGTGLGLPITKAIIDKYGGSVHVDSAPGNGSRFAVRLPDADRDTGT